MRIGSNPGYSVYLDKVQSEVKKPAEKAEERKSLVGKTGHDRLELSNEMKDIKGYASSQVNSERIESLKQVIASGQYEVSSEELANAMIRRMAE